MEPLLMFSTQSIIYAWDNSLSYALALLDDLNDEHMVLQPGGSMNHPAWILGHLSLYYPIVPALIRGESFADPADDEMFGYRGCGPQTDGSIYGTKESQVKRLVDGHEHVVETLLGATTGQLRQAPSLPRWAEMYPTVEFMLPDLLIHHESLHIGQLSIWRRAAGLPRVEFPDRTPRKGLTDLGG